MSHLDRVEAAEWLGSEELPSGLRSIGYLGIENVDDFHLPNTLERIDELEIEWSRVALPLSVRAIGRLRIWYGDAALTCEGVTNFGEVNLTNVDFVFPEGTLDIAALTASASSVTLPSTLRMIGDIDFRNDYDKSNDVTWAEGAVAVGTIRMDGPTFIRVPYSVAAIAAVLVGPDARLEVPATTLIKGEETIRTGGRLARI